VGGRVVSSRVMHDPARRAPDSHQSCLVALNTATCVCSAGLNFVGARKQPLNYRKVMGRVCSLADLFALSEKAMAELLGNPQDAKKLHKFVNQHPPV